MKTVFKYAAALAVATATISAPALAGSKPPELSASELTAAQTHNYNVPADVAFKSVVATLQSLGYIDINSSRDAGTISGVTESKAKVIYNILWGFGKKKMTQKASLLVEDNGPAGSVVHLNLLVSQTKARGIFGTSFSDGQMVKTAEPYAEFFTAMDAEVAKRAAVAAAVPAAAPAGAAVEAMPAAAAPAAPAPAAAAPAAASSEPVRTAPASASLVATTPNK